MSNEALAVQADPLETREPITFSATGSEYFRIWIVNLLLTIVTLGIYSAWAKVRRNQYFYSSTRLAGSSFEYHGNPLAILKGRLIALVLVGVYNLAFHFSLAAGFIMMAVMAAVMPWLLWRSLQFSLYNSSYRGIRFGFDGSAGKAYLAFLGMPVLTAISFGLLTPFAHQRLRRFEHTEARFGSTKFSFSASVGAFYKLYLVMLGLGVLVLLFAFLAGVAGALFGASGQPDQRTSLAGPLFVVLLTYPLVFAMGWMFMAMLQNLVWNNTQLAGHRFASTMRRRTLMWIYLTNTVGILLTLGLYTPFAKVRALKYRLESISLTVAGSLDDVAAHDGGEVAAAGEGVADFLGVDLAL